MNEKKEYIDRGLYCETICRCNGTACDKSKCPIWNAPVADVAPVVHGHWVNIVDYGGGNCVGYCSVCKAEHASSNPTALRITFAYCRWCGAKMERWTEETMNLLEHYIVKVHREHEVHLNPDFVKVDLTYDCYGTIRRCLKMFRKSEWEKAKKKGVFLE